MYAADPIGPIGGQALLLFLSQVGLLLLAALVLGRLAARMKLPAITGELLAGVLLGPSVLGSIAPGAAQWLFPRDATQVHMLDAFCQIGVLLLVAVTGLELDLCLVRRRGGTAICVSVPGAAIPFGLGVAVGFAVPASILPGTTDRTVFAVFLGVALCVSAIPVIAKTLVDMNLLHRNVGQLTLVAGTVDDLLGWLGLTVVSAMATNGLRAGHLAASWLPMAVFLTVGAVAGWAVIRLAIRLAARSTEPGATVAVVVAAVVLGAATAAAAGLEPVVGALLVGVLVGSCPDLDRNRLGGLHALVMWVLAPAFFATVGLRIDLGALGDPALAGAALVLLLAAVAGKFGGAYAGARAGRLDRWEALAVGAGMNSRGVIQIIVATVGLRLAVLDSATYTVIVLIALITSLMAAPILRFAMGRVEVTADERLRARNSLRWQRPDEAAGAESADPGAAAAGQPRVPTKTA